MLHRSMRFVDDGSFDAILLRYSSLSTLEQMYGGVRDPKTGKAIQYERSVEIEMVETQRGGKKLVKKTVEQTSWLGLPKLGSKAKSPLVREDIILG